MQIKMAGFYVYVDITVAKINDAMKYRSSSKKITTAEKNAQKSSGNESQVAIVFDELYCY